MNFSLDNPGFNICHFFPHSGTRYGTESGSDLALLEERDEEAPGRYRSLYRTARSQLFALIALKLH